MNNIPIDLISSPFVDADRRFVTHIPGMAAALILLLIEGAWTAASTEEVSAVEAECMVEAAGGVKGAIPWSVM